ncbi:MAG: hypothetical protein JW726_15760 [Anaerolineales bacterium]|nr:hypothetical protein [Anaerolineales bacterium]
MSTLALEQAGLRPCILAALADALRQPLAEEMVLIGNVDKGPLFSRPYKSPIPVSQIAHTAAPARAL